jgi:hypothetical protein
LVGSQKRFFLDREDNFFKLMIANTNKNIPIKVDSERNRERRKEDRVPVQFTIMADGQMFNCIDISKSGLYLYTGRSFEENKIVSITLPIKDNPFTVKVRVQHNQPGIGMGLQFIDLDSGQKALINQLIRGIANTSSKAEDEKKKVLFIEANEMCRQIYKSHLLMVGFSVIEAKDGSVPVDTISGLTRNPKKFPNLLRLLSQKKTDNLLTEKCIRFPQ